MRDAAVTFVTGTDTDVGKTITTAALAAALSANGATVAVYKPTQTGVLPGGHGDADEVARLSGVGTVREGIRLRDPMAPVAAAMRENRRLPTVQDHVECIWELSGSFDHVLVEGAGGLLVELDAQGNTLADVAAEAGDIARTGFVVTCRSGLGTLNHTALTLEALRHRGVPSPALVVGSWPVAPSDIDLSNRKSLQALGTPFLGSLPEGAALLDPQVFQRMAAEWLALPSWT
ncbi:MAG: dethiobiotin synthase [Specibacter sp.]